MKKTALLLTVLTLFALLLVGAAGADDAENVHTLDGEYVWNHRGHKGDLTAKFTPTGENTWDVAFHFVFRDRPHVYRGTAEGSLEDGPLSGTVQNENKRRKWTFEGSFEEGVFHGQHAEIENGEPFDTGTLTLGG